MGISPHGLPHSDICGSQRICRSPQLFAACHVLLRLREPRHPPCALSCSVISFITELSSICCRHRFARCETLLCFYSCLSLNRLLPVLASIMSLFSSGGLRGGQAAQSCIFFHSDKPLVSLHFSRKEVFQPHLPVRLPCYDLAPVTDFALGRASRRRTSGALGSHGLTGGVYKARERIHRAMADARLLANPASRSRVADSDPN